MVKIKLQEVLTEFFGEFLGTSIMMSYGLTGVASNFFSTSSSPFVGPVSFGFGVIFAMLSCAHISGAHLNPVFSIAMCMLGRLPLWKLGHYFLAQVTGSIFGSSIVYILYFQSIHAYELQVNLADRHKLAEETAAIFITRPAVHVTLSVAMLDQVFTTSLIVFAVLFIIDQRCFKTPFALQAFIIGGAIVSVGAGTGFNCGAILNPARDIGPRVLLYFLGYNKIVFSALNGQFWWAVGILSPCIGAVFGTILFYFVERMRKTAESSTRLSLTNDSKSARLEEYSAA